MDVLAFTGPPGSGKSDRALVVAYENKASCIIDDGILIYHNRIVAGKSAKKGSQPFNGGTPRAFLGFKSGGRCNFPYYENQSGAYFNPRHI